MQFNGVFNNTKVLVTGDTGFKGSWLCTWLLNLGADVYGLADRVYDNPNMFESIGLDSRIKHSECDICDLEKLGTIINEIQPDFVFHLAAQAIVSESYANPVQTFATNAIGTANMLECLRRYEKTCAAVFITSDKCYENQEWVWGYRETDALGGKDPYSASKAAAEVAIHSFVTSFFDSNHPVKIGTGRAGNVIGGGDWAKDRIVPDSARNWAAGDHVTIRRPDATRPWQHVMEPISGYLRLAQNLCSEQPRHGEAYNFGPDAAQDITVLQLLEQLLKSWDLDIDRPINVESSDSFGESGLLKLNCDKALSHLAWTPVLSFAECADMTATWYQDYYADKSAFELTVQQIEQYQALAKERNLTWA